MTAATDPPKAWARPWATARPYARPMPRAGAWYPVVGEAGDGRTVLEIRGKRVAIQKKFLEIRDKRPETFTAVVRSRATIATVLQTRGTTFDRVYAVCPSCMNRLTVFENQAAASCKQCGHTGEIAWWETG
jgi:ribosomal protein S27E